MVVVDSSDKLTPRVSTIDKEKPNLPEFKTHIIIHVILNYKV